MAEPISTVVTTLVIDRGVPILQSLAVKLWDRLRKRSAASPEATNLIPEDHTCAIAAVNARIEDLERDIAQAAEGAASDLSKLKEALSSLSLRSDELQKELRGVSRRVDSQQKALIAAWIAIGCLVVWAAFSLGLVLRA